MKQTLEYLEFLGVTRNQIVREHLKLLLKGMLSKKWFWLILGLTIGISAGYFTNTKVPALITSHTIKEVVYVPAISIDSNTMAFMNAIATFESGGNYTANNGKYLGKYQIGDDLREELGYGSLNTTSGHKQFLNTPELQDIIMLQSIRYSERELAHYIATYSNKKIGSHYLTKSGIIAIAHACGVNGCKAFINSRGNYIPDNGRKITDYLQFNNFKL